MNKRLVFLAILLMFGLMLLGCVSYEGYGYGHGYGYYGSPHSHHYYDYGYPNRHHPYDRGWDLHQGSGHGHRH